MLAGHHPFYFLHNHPWVQAETEKALQNGVVLTENHYYMILHEINCYLIRLPQTFDPKLLSLL